MPGLFMMALLAATHCSTFWRSSDAIFFCQVLRIEDGAAYYADGSDRQQGPPV